MADTTFIDYSEPAVSAAWLNDVNRLAYKYRIYPESYGFSPTASAASNRTFFAAAVADAAVLGGIVTISPGTFTIAGPVLEIPPYVDITGAGKKATKFVCGDNTAGFRFIDGTSPADGRGGQSSGFTWDGNWLATTPMTLNLAVERSWSEIAVINSSVGWALNGTQNNSFFNCDSQNHTNATIVFDYGAGNNRFFGGEWNRSGQWLIKFQHTADYSVIGDAGAFTEATGNVFYSSVIERLGYFNSSGTLVDADLANGLVYHGAGKWNGFVGTGFALPELDSSTKPLILVEQAGARPSILLTIDNCYFSGVTGRTNAIEVRAGCSIVVDGRISFENHTTAFLLNDTARVYGTFTPTTGSVTNYFANQGGGTAPMTNLILNESRMHQRYVVPLDRVATSISVDGETWTRTENYPGFSRTGDGASVANITAGFVEKYGIDGYQINNSSGGSSFVLNIGPIDLVIGNGVPSAAAPAGSLAVNTAGSSGSMWYRRVGGAWTAFA